MSDDEGVTQVCTLLGTPFRTGDNEGVVRFRQNKRYEICVDGGGTRRSENVRPRRVPTEKS